MNFDKLKEELILTKKSVCDNLSKEEEEEINIFIEHLIEQLQKKFKKIDYKNIANNLSKYISDNVKEEQ